MKAMLIWMDQAALKCRPPNNQSTTLGTNHQFIRPTWDTRLYQPALKFDYQVTAGLRASFKYQGNNLSKRVTLGSLPGWNDGITPIPRKGTEARWRASSTVI